MCLLNLVLGLFLVVTPGGDGSTLAQSYGFENIEIYKVERGVFDLAFADLDGDGRDDLGFINNAKSRVELYLRLPDGRADEVDPSDPEKINTITYDGRFRKEFLPVEQEVYGLALGRFDRDAVVDAAFVTATAHLVVVHRGRQNEQRRTRVKLESFESQMANLIAVDLDADGLDELILLGESKTLVWRASGKITTLHNLYKNPFGLRLADFNGDGLKDLLYAYPKGDYPFVLRFQVAPGEFGLASTWKLETIRAFDAKDIDADGRAEILAIYKNSGRLAVLGLEAGGDPGLRFFSSRELGDKDDALGFTTGDVDGDGADEVIVSDALAARVSLIGGLGGVDPLQVTSSPSLRGVIDPRLADIEGDARPELVAISSTEGVIGVTPAGADLGFPRFINIEGQPLAIDSGDVNGDGLIDVVCLSVKGEGRGREYYLTMLTKNQEGELESRGELIQSAKAKKKLIKKVPEDVLLADVDRDGRLDVLLFMPGEAPLILCQGLRPDPEDPLSGAISGETPGMGLLDGARQWSVCQSDVVGDGDRELAVASGNLIRFIFLPDGEKPVPQAARQYNGSDPSVRFEGCAWADVTGDPSSELIVFEKTSASVQVIGEHDEELVRIDAGRIKFQGFATPDLDGDGKRDILVAGSETLGVWLAGTECFSLQERDTYESRDEDTYFYDLATGDVNPSGEMETVLIDSGQDSLFVLAMQEEGMKHALKFRVFEEKLFQSQRAGTEPHWIEIHDLTGDGRDDLIILVHDKIIIYPQD